jgi:thiol-disulfide isomerase/thioredoxin
MTSRLGLLLMALALAAGGCAAGLRGGRPKDGPPELRVLLLNGGGNAAVNYLSHVRHIRDLYAVLRGAGVDGAQISVLSADGEAPGLDLAVSRPASGGEAWLLDGTYLERSLRRPTRYVSTRIAEIPVTPARRSDLDGWFDDTAGTLRAGDTLFFFVTDHGERGKTPAEGRITLWQRESVSVAELSALVAKLPPGVRVVAAMSQCYSGAFAQLGLTGTPERPVGSTCGYFSTTAERPAYGCYPDSIGRPDEGHAFALIAGLERNRSLPGAHADALLTDRTPDVPIRTSDVYAARVVEATAAARGVSPEELVSTLGATAMSADPQEGALLERIARSFAIDLPRAPGELQALTRRLEELRARMNDSVGIWTVATGDLTQANLDGFLGAHPRWQSIISPRALARVPFSELGAVQTSFLKELGAYTAARPGTVDRLKHGFSRRSAAQAAAFRSEVRAAALLRMRTLLFTLVGRHLLATEGTAAQRAELEALRACERLSLPPAPPSRPPLTLPADFPPVSSDERLLRAVSPASFGAALAEPPAEVRSNAALPAGAAAVVAVEPRSPAEAAGLRPGDLLLGGVGDHVRDRGGMKLYLASWREQSDQQLEFIRNGARLKTDARPRANASAVEAKDLPAAGRATLGALTTYAGPVAATLGARKPRLLFFWATWCTFCKHAVPELLALERERGIPVVAITDESPGVLEEFFGRWVDPFPKTLAIDPDRRVNEGFQIDGYPTFVLVDENGRVQMRSVGYRVNAGLPIPGWTFKRR